MKSVLSPYLPFILVVNLLLCCLNVFNVCLFLAGTLFHALFNPRNLLIHNITQLITKRLATLCLRSGSFNCIFRTLGRGFVLLLFLIYFHIYGVGLRLRSKIISILYILSKFKAHIFRLSLILSDGDSLHRKFS